MAKQRPLIDSEPITVEGFVTDRFRQTFNKLTNHLPIVGSGSPEGVIDAFQWSLYIDSTGVSILWIKKYTDIGGDVTKGWEALTGAEVSEAYLAVTGDYTVTIDDSLINVTVSGTTITLMSMVGIAGKLWTIKNSSTGNITVDTTSGQTIDGTLTATIPTLAAMKIASDGANAIII